MGRRGVEIHASGFRVDPFVAVALAVALAVHLVAAPNYGYFRDELYYLACAKRLDWGYVDQPPLSIAVLTLWTKLFGTALWVIRLPVIFAHLGTAVLGAAICRRLGGGENAQRLALIAVLAAPVHLMLGHLYAMNGLDVLLTYALVWAWLESMRKPRLWLVWGLLLGLGLLNKWSVLWPLAGMGLAMLATERRKELASPLPWIGLGIGAALFAPNLIWQSQHHWPTLEFMRNAMAYKMNSVPVWQFIASQCVVMNPFTLPLLVYGLWHGWKSEHRPFVVAFLVVALILIVSGKSRVNYLTPSYALLLPLGALMMEKKSKASFYPFALAASGLAMSLIMMPILPAATLAQLYARLPAPPADEKGEKSPLQGFADMFGWRELAEAVNKAYAKIPEADRAGAVVVAGNYGEAAALEFYGAPNVVCGHNQYWLWPRPTWDGKAAILVGDAGRKAEFAELREGGLPARSLATPEESKVRVWIGRDARKPELLVERRFE